MTLTLNEMIADARPGEVDKIIHLMNIVADDQSYKLLVKERLGKGHEFEHRKPLLDIGHFSGMDLIQLMLEDNAPSEIRPAIVARLLEKLIDWVLVQDSQILGNNLIIRYQWRKERVRAFLSLGILENVLLGPAYVAKKYAPSVPAVYVKKAEDDHIGTCFLTSTASGQLVLITAKHNVDPSDDITFLRLSSPEDAIYHPLQDSWSLHPKLDMALMPVSCNKPLTPIYAIGRASVMARTISLGYPRVATTDGAYLFAHAGEINACVSTYFGEKRLIISNIVAPGNSGGPVLNEAGLCVGMVVDSFETKHSGGTTISNSAILSDELRKFADDHD